LRQADFINRLIEYDFDSMTNKKWKVLKPFVTNHKLNHQNLKKKNLTIARLYDFIVAASRYYELKNSLEVK